MVTVEFDVQLDRTGLKWNRVRFTTAKGRVIAYTVQYETTVGGKPAPIVRFDNAHGFPHQDVLDRRGVVVEKRELHELSAPGEALNAAMREIQENWQRYRRRYFGDPS